MDKKRNIWALFLVIVMLTGCGETRSSSESSSLDTGSESETSVAEQEQDTNSGSLFFEDTMISVPMGTYSNGEQKRFCTVDMPSEYQFFASYTDENGVGRTYNETGDILLREAFYDGFLDSIEEEISYAWLLSPNSDESILYTVSALEEDSLEAIKERVPSGTEFGTTDYPAYWYEEEYEGSHNTYISYKISDSVTLSMVYSIPADIEYDSDEMAQKLYDLVTVTEHD